LDDPNTADTITGTTIQNTVEGFLVNKKTNDFAPDNLPTDDFVDTVVPDEEEIAIDIGHDMSTKIRKNEFEGVEEEKLPGEFSVEKTLKKSTHITVDESKVVPNNTPAVEKKPMNPLKSVLNDLISSNASQKTPKSAQQNHSDPYREPLS
jgi:hypothetical protein